MMKNKVLSIVLAACLFGALCAPAASAETVMWLPDGIKVVEEQAFMNAPMGYYVMLPYGVTTIRSKAFANTDIEWITLPSSITYIAPDAFTGSYNAWAIVDENSYAYTWCVNNGVHPDVITGGVTASASAAELGSTVTITVETTDTWGDEKYQWQQSSNNSSWSNCTMYGSTSKTLSFTANSTNMNRYYRCVVTDYVSKWYSNSVKPEIITSTSSTKYRALLIGEVNFSPVCNRNWGDVQLMSSMLASIKGPTGGTYSVTTKKNLTPSGIQSAISSAFAGADSDDVSLFFIATHGDASSSGVYAGALATVDSSGNESFILMSTLANYLKAVPGKVIVILESCGSGAGIYDPSVPQNSSNAIQNGTESFTSAAITAFSSVDPYLEVEQAPVEYDEDGVVIEQSYETGEFRQSKFCVLAASRYLQLSWGTESGPYNYFTYDLTRGVGTSGHMPADTNYNSLTTLHELFTYIKTYGDPRTYSDGAQQNVQVYPTNSSYNLFKR